MRAGKLNLTAEQGAVFRRVISWEDGDGAPLPFDGPLRMHVRKQPSSNTPILVLTTENDGIVVDGNSATITIPATTMAAAPSGIAHYDLEYVSDGNEEETMRLLEGTFTISREITRDQGVT